MVKASADFATIFLGRRVTIREPLSKGETRYLGTLRVDGGDALIADDVLALLSRKATGGGLVCVTYRHIVNSSNHQSQSQWSTDEHNALGMLSFAAALMDKPNPATRLRRMCAILTSELCRHALGLQHCHYYRCILNSQHADDLLLTLCPVCLRKLHVATEGFDVLRHYEAMLAWLREHDIGIDPTMAWIEDRLQAITS
jgi:hypothetical protein